MRISVDTFEAWRGLRLSFVDPKTSNHCSYLRALAPWLRSQPPQDGRPALRQLVDDLMQQGGRARDNEHVKAFRQDVGAQTTTGQNRFCRSKDGRRSQAALRRPIQSRGFKSSRLAKTPDLQGAEAAPS